MSDSPDVREFTRCGKPIYFFRKRREDEPEEQHKRLKLEWQKANKSAWTKKFYASHKVKNAAYAKEYLAKHREDPAWRAKMRNVQAKNRTAAGPEILRWRALRSHDKKVGRDFTLSFSDFMLHAVSSCIYCGKEDAGGVDRLNSDIGHIPDNCVPCCYTCNKMKMAMTLEEFALHIEAIHARFKLIAAAGVI